MLTNVIFDNLNLDKSEGDNLADIGIVDGADEKVRAKCDLVVSSFSSRQYSLVLTNS